jgi:tetratricopeptide (TPR) repeat protein
MDDILQRYLDMENSGIGTYFDADEIVELLDYFEDMDDLDHYNKVVEIGQKLHPHNTDIQTRMCRACIFNEHFEKALVLIEQLGDTGNHELKLLKCECLGALDRYDELIACLETMETDANEELQDTYEYLAQILREQYDSKYAYDFIQRGLALFPDSVIIKEELCFHLDMQGDTERTIEICQELIDCDPYRMDYWYILGRQYAIMEAYDKAIEAYDFALVTEPNDLEIKILKAFCYLMKENFEKVDEIYKDVFPEETNVKTDLSLPYIKIADDVAEYAYKLLKKMIENFDTPSMKGSPRSLLEYQEEEANGFFCVTDCFPGRLLFFLCKELLLMAEGDQNAMQNVEQVIQMIYQNGTNNENFRLDTTSQLCLLPKQKIEKLLAAAQTPDMEPNEDNDYVVRQIIEHLLEGNISMFCQLYAQSSPEAITDYLEKIFPACKRRKKRNNSYLLADEIYRNNNNNISSSELSAKFMANKNLQN